MYEIKEYIVDLYEVSISTLDGCTRKCAYCKYGSMRNNKRKRIMDEWVFEKILYDLREINFSGIISPFEGNEPLLDSRIFRFIEKIANMLPNSKSFIYTNGDLLTEGVLSDLFNSGLKKVFISLHVNFKLSYFNYLCELFGNDRIEITKYYELDKRIHFHNFAGLIKNNIVSQNLYPNNGCYLPFRQLVIDPEGFVGLCCVDIADKCTFQNVKNKSVIDIFYYNEKLNEIRAKLSKNSREGLKYCSQCSFHGNSLKIPL